MSKRQFYFMSVLGFVMLITFLSGCGSSNTESNAQSESGEGAEEIDYPNQDVDIVVPFKPGGASDAHARILERHFKDEFGHALSFIYKPGGAAAVGSAEVAQMEGDGSTIMAANYPDIVVQPLTGSGSFKSEDFEYIAQVSSDPAILAVPSDSSFTSLEELVKEAKEKPGEISIGAPLNTSLHLSLLDFMEQSGIDVTIIPYTGGAEAKSRLLGGHLDAAWVNLGVMIEEIDSIQPLAVTTEERYDQIPDVPTFTEQGYEIVSALGRIYVTPKGISDEKLKILREGISNIAENPDYQKEMSNIGQSVKFINGEEVDKMVNEYKEYAKELIEKHNLSK
ncbi:tripartite tricarboxylate transporter substrate binding protein [Bacillus piscicola]|uniref:tripartite tricarboxylate transporter substrate binding protein n=1 Tax=Bacillus piscicola TaxID=1632684 RepID=UPI001F08EC50|nr:tripartite tricarboxylate transporter substrate binding protein [Bacillus piscicola]